MERIISTYTPEEKEAMKKLDNFEAQIRENLNEDEAISSIEYYRSANIVDGAKREFTINSDIFICEKKLADGTKETEIYALNGNNLIGIVDENGNIEFVDEKLKSLEIEMSLDDFKQINIENLLIKSKELTSEELEEYINRAKENNKDKEEEKAINEENEKEDETKEMEEEMAEATGEEFDFIYYKKVKAPGFGDEIKSAKGKDVALAIDKKLGVMLIDTEKKEILNGTEIGKPTTRTALTVNDKGNKVERQNLNAIIKTKEKNKEIGIRFDKYGDSELYTMEVTPCAERVARRETLHGESDKRMDLETKRELNDHDERHEVAENYDKTENFHQGEEINEDTEIILKDGSKTTMKEEASKAKVSPDEFINKYKIAEGKSPADKVENVHEEIEEEFGTPSFKRH